MNNEIKTEQMATYEYGVMSSKYKLASNSYDEYLENQRKIWIADFKNKIINQIKN